MSVEEFRRLPKPVGDFDYELHHGELAQVTRPKKKHHVARHRLLDLLKQLQGRQGHIGIEVLSPSNTAPEMYGREQFCLEHGSKEFWTVDLGRRQVRVASNDQPVKSYREGSEIPLLAFGGGGLRVSDIFSED